MIFGLLSALFTGGISLAGDYIKGKGEEKRLQIQNEQERIKNIGIVEKAAAEAKAKAMVTRMEGDIAWENIWATGAQTSWKDEHWQIVLAMPYTLPWVPAIVAILANVNDPASAQAAIATAFNTIGKIPEFWHWAAGISIGAAFGVKKVTDFFSLKKGI